MKRIILVAAGLAALASLSACATSRVKRIDVQEVVDLSGRWNDTDAQNVAKEMIKSVLDSNWSADYYNSKKRLPVVIVGLVKNQTEEHINSEVFTKSLEAALISSGKVKVVASRDERPPVRQERNEQQEGLTDPATVKKIGKELGADFMLMGSMNTVKDLFSSRYVILYQTNLELIDIETNQKVWLGQAQLKKIVQRSKYSL